MEKLKKILLPVGVVIFLAVFGIWMLSSDIEHIEDTNGPDNYSLQQITDSNIINMDVGALNHNKATDTLTNTVSYFSDKFTGVAEIYSDNIITNRFDITVNHAQVTSGNFRLVLVYNDKIVHDFKLNEIMQSYTLENVNGHISLRIAGESANYYFDYLLY